MVSMTIADIQGIASYAVRYAHALLAMTLNGSYLLTPTSRLANVVPL